VKLAAWRDFEI